MYKKETVLIIEYIKLPEKFKREFAERFNFHNDSYLAHISELEPYGDKTWADTCNWDAIKEYHRDQAETNDFEEDLDAFIKDYGLEFDVWMIENNIDLTGVKKILIDVSW